MSALIPMAPAKTPPGALTPAQIKQYERNRKKEEVERKKLLQKAAQKAKKITLSMVNVAPVMRPDVDVSEDELEPLQAKAEQGDAAAMVRLGHYYMMHVEPREANVAKAGKWFKQAAETGDADALAWLGLYMRMTQPKKDVAEANGFFRESAEKGSMLGEFFMGLVTERGPEKLEWYEKAAKRGFVPAMHALAEAISEYNYYLVPSLKNVCVTPDAQAWGLIAAGHGDFKAYGVLMQEGANFAGSEKERPYVDYKKLESYGQKQIELIKTLKYTWYGSNFDCRLMIDRFSWGGPRAYAYLTAYSDAFMVLYRQKKNEAPFFKKFHDEITKMADAGDRDAMLVIVKAAKNWSFFFPFAKTPCPFKAEPYESKLKEMAKSDPLIPFLLAK